MKAGVVHGPKQLVIEDRPIPKPGPGEIRIRVHACGVCHSDMFVTEGMWPGLEYPRIPGHEVAGVVDALGEGVSQQRVGNRVGVGWHGGHDGVCDPCLKGKFIHCEHAQITGLTRDGGYAEYAVTDAAAVARVPEGMSFTDAGPLLCAGVTTFNALRNAGARSGDLVAVQGLGGLGHLGVQYARAMGFEVVAVSRGEDKREFAHQLGAHHFVDAKAGAPAAALRALGGPRVILATAPHAASISAVVGGLGLEGCLMIVAAPFEPIQVGAIDLISGDRRIQGWSSGTATDSTDAMAFAQQHGIRPMIETFPLDDAGAALERMASGAVRFRSVIAVAD